MLHIIYKFTAMIILHFDLQPQFNFRNCFIYTSHHFTSHGRYKLNKLTSLPMCGFIAQLVEGSNPVEALIFSGFIFSIALIGKFTAMIILHFKNSCVRRIVLCGLVELLGR